MKVIAKTIALTTLSLICMSASAQQIVFKTEFKNAQNETVTIERRILNTHQSQNYLIQKLKEVNPEYYDQAWQYTKEAVYYLGDDDFESLNDYQQAKMREILFPIAIKYLIQYHPEVFQ